MGFYLYHRSYLLWSPVIVKILHRLKRSGMALFSAFGFTETKT